MAPGPGPVGQLHDFQRVGERYDHRQEGSRRLATLDDLGGVLLVADDAGHQALKPGMCSMSMKSWGLHPQQDSRSDLFKIAR